MRREYPQWLDHQLRNLLGARFDAEMAALGVEAPLDLRVNTLKATREQAIAALAESNIAAVPTPLSPLGLRVRGRPPLATLPCFRDGLVEVQDEGSQLAALLVDARPGMRVVDFCAGAGGKTLAMAAAMRNKGHIVACDVLQGRVDRAATRLNRARRPQCRAARALDRARSLGQAPRPQLRPRAGRRALQRRRHLAAQSRRQVAIHDGRSDGGDRPAAPHP